MLPGIQSGGNTGLLLSSRGSMGDRAADVQSTGAERLLVIPRGIFLSARTSGECVLTAQVGKRRGNGMALAAYGGREGST